MSKIVRKQEEAKERERILKLYWSQYYFKWNKVTINLQSYAPIKNLIRDRDNNVDVPHKNIVDILNFGLALCVSLSRSEFRKTIYNETKFENDFKMAILIKPLMTVAYFQRIEIERLKGIQNIIEKCLYGTELYQNHDGYIGLCIYLDFLQTFNPIENINNSSSQQYEVDDKTVIGSKRYNRMYVLLMNAYEEAEFTSKFEINGLIEKAKFFGVEKERLLVEAHQVVKEDILKDNKLVLNSAIQTYKFHVETLVTPEIRNTDTFISFLATVMSSSNYKYNDIEDKYEFEDDLISESVETFLAYLMAENLKQILKPEIEQINTGEITPTKAKTSQLDYGKMQYKQDALQVLHGYFNSDGKLWESIDVHEFFNNFKEVPAGTLKLKNVEGFCFLMGLYEDAKIDINNINHWFMAHFPEIKNYSKQKAKKDVNAKLTENKKIQEYITNKLQQIQF